MEFIIGFAIGLILAQTISCIMYKNSLDEMQIEHTRRMNKIMEMLDEYNR